MFHYDILFKFNEQYLLHYIKIICKKTQGKEEHIIYEHIPVKLIRLRERLITAIMIKDAVNLWRVLHNESKNGVCVVSYLLHAF